MNALQYSLILIASSLVGNVVLAQTPATAAVKTTAATQPAVKSADATVKTAEAAKVDATKKDVTKTAAMEKTAATSTAAVPHKHHANAKHDQTKMTKTANTAATEKKPEVKADVKTTEPVSKTAAMVKTK
jgi:hypothetical protein